MITMFCFLLIGTVNYAQKLSEKKLKKLSEFEISWANYNINDTLVSKELCNILRSDKKKKWMEPFGIVFVSVATILVVAGVGTKNSNGSYNDDIGSGIISMGVVSGIVS